MASGNIYLCLVSVERIVDGASKKVSERYLVDAVSPSDAEAIIVGEIGSSDLVSYEVKSIKKESVGGIFTCNGDKWYKFTVNYLTTDEKSGEEKKTKQGYYLRSSVFEDAVADMQKSMKGTISDYEFTSIVETPIIELLSDK